MQPTNSSVDGWRIRKLPKVMPNADLADLQLEYLLLFTQREDRAVNVFRSFADNWNAHSLGGPFETKTGRSKWFNNPDLKRARALRRHGIPTSVEVGAALDAGRQIRMVVDHAVPLGVIRMKLTEAKPQSKNEIESLLRSLYKLVILTKDQDSDLNKRFKSSMPKDWCGKDVYARYKSVGIQIRDPIQPKPQT